MCGKIVDIQVKEPKEEEEEIFVLAHRVNNSKNVTLQIQYNII